jgi:hypothetical protein
MRTPLSMCCLLLDVNTECGIINTVRRTVLMVVLKSVLLKNIRYVAPLQFF